MPPTGGPCDDVRGMSNPEVRFPVRLTPRGGADRIEGVGEDGSLRARVAAAPIDDAANAALLRLIARELRLPPTAVRVVSGAKRRQKTVALDGIAASTVLAHWPGLVLRR